MFWFYIQGKRSIYSRVWYKRRIEITIASTAKKNFRVLEKAKTKMEWLKKIMVVKYEKVEGRKGREEEYRKA